MTGIDMPMQLKDITRFERQNNVSISVYGWEPARKDESGDDELGSAYHYAIHRKSNLIMSIS